MHSLFFCRCPTSSEKPPTCFATFSPGLTVCFSHSLLDSLGVIPPKTELIVLVPKRGSFRMKKGPLVYKSVPFKYPSTDREEPLRQRRAEEKRLLTRPYAEPYCFFLPAIGAAGGLGSPASVPTSAFPDGSSGNAASPIGGATPRRPRFTPATPVPPFLASIAFELCGVASEAGLLDEKAFTTGLLRLEIRPAAITRAFRFFEGDRHGIVAVKTVLDALEELVAPGTPRAERALRACFNLFTSEGYPDRIDKATLVDRRVARTERDGCSRAMVSELVRAVRAMPRFPGDHRQFLSFEEFCRVFRCDNGLKGAELVAAFLPRLLALLEDGDLWMASSSAASRHGSGNGTPLPPAPPKTARR